MSYTVQTQNIHLPLASFVTSLFSSLSPPLLLFLNPWGLFGICILMTEHHYIYAVLGVALDLSIGFGQGPKRI